MTTIQQRLRLAPPKSFSDHPANGDLAIPDHKAYHYPPLLFVAPVVSGLLLLTWIFSVTGAVVAIFFTTIAVALNSMVFDLAKSRLRGYAPSCSETDLGGFARFALAPLWIAEGGRLCSAEALFVFYGRDPVHVLRNVLHPVELLGSPSEMLTVAGAIGMMLRFYFTARHLRSDLPGARIISTGLGILGRIWSVYVLCSLAALFAIHVLMSTALRVNMLM